MRVYAVMVIGKDYRTISSECYSTYDKAVDFIKTRSERPAKEGDYTFRADSVTYQIEMLNVR